MSPVSTVSLVYLVSLIRLRLRFVAAQYSVLQSEDTNKMFSGFKSV